MVVTVVAPALATAPKPPEGSCGNARRKSKADADADDGFSVLGSPEDKAPWPERKEKALPVALPLVCMVDGTVPSPSFFVSPLAVAVTPPFRSKPPNIVVAEWRIVSRRKNEREETKMQTATCWLQLSVWQRGVFVVALDVVGQLDAPFIHHRVVLRYSHSPYLYSHVL